MFLKSLDDANLDTKSYVYDEAFEKAHEKEIETYFKSVENVFVKHDLVNLSVLKSTKDNAKKTLVIIPGRAECEYKYAFLLYCLKDLPLNIYIFFVRGQGKSTAYYKDSKKCHIDRFKDYTDDINYLLSYFKITDYSLMAFSLGGLISLSLYKRYDNKPQKIALMAPYIWPYFPVPNFLLQSIIYTSVYLGLKESYTPHGKEYKFVEFKDNHHSHSEYRYNKYHAHYAKHPDEKPAGPSFNFVYECLKEQKALFKDPLNFDREIMCIVAMDDKVVDKDMCLKFFNKHANDSTKPFVICANKAYHDILNEKTSIQKTALNCALSFLIGDIS